MQKRNAPTAPGPIPRVATPVALLAPTTRSKGVRPGEAHGGPGVGEHLAVVEGPKPGGLTHRHQDPVLRGVLHRCWHGGTGGAEPLKPSVPDGVDASLIPGDEPRRKKRHRRGGSEDWESLGLVQAQHVDPHLQVDIPVTIDGGVDDVTGGGPREALEGRRRDSTQRWADEDPVGEGGGGDEAGVGDGEAREGLAVGIFADEGGPQLLGEDHVVVEEGGRGHHLHVVALGPIGEEPGPHRHAQGALEVLIAVVLDGVDGHLCVANGDEEETGEAALDGHEGGVGVIEPLDGGLGGDAERTAVFGEAGAGLIGQDAIGHYEAAHVAVAPGRRGGEGDGAGGGEKAAVGDAVAGPLKTLGPGGGHREVDEAAHIFAAGDEDAVAVGGDVEIEDAEAKVLGAADGGAQATIEGGADHLVVVTGQEELICVRALLDGGDQVVGGARDPREGLPGGVLVETSRRHADLPFAFALSFPFALSFSFSFALSFSFSFALSFAFAFSLALSFAFSFTLALSFTGRIRLDGVEAGEVREAATRHETKDHQQASKAAEILETRETRETVKVGGARDHSVSSSARAAAPPTTRTPPPMTPHQGEGVEEGTIALGLGLGVFGVVCAGAKLGGGGLEEEGGDVARVEAGGDPGDADTHAHPARHQEGAGADAKELVHLAVDLAEEALGGGADALPGDAGEGGEGAAIGAGEGEDPGVAQAAQLACHQLGRVEGAGNLREAADLVAGPHLLLVLLDVEERADVSRAHHLEGGVTTGAGEDLLVEEADGALVGPGPRHQRCHEDPLGLRRRRREGHQGEERDKTRQGAHALLPNQGTLTQARLHRLRCRRVP